MAVYSKFVGMDVHKETIAVSVAETFGGEVRYQGEIRNTPEAVGKLIRQLQKGGAKLLCCYEAGPCGYVLHRQLLGMGVANQVVAPSLIPKKPGDRIKTDRRDSQTLARLLRAGELTAVWVPDEAQEALRDLTRGREDLKHLERQAKQRLQAFLLRHGKVYGHEKKWTRMHFHWFENVKFDQPIQQFVFQDYLDTLQMLTRQVEALEKQLESAGSASGFGPVIEGLMALRGISRIAATTTMAEIGDLHRFPTAPQLMAYLGLVPSEHSQRSHSVPRRHHENRQRPRPAGPGRGSLDLSPSGAEDSTSPATGEARPGGGPGNRLEGPESSLCALPAAGSQGQAQGQGLHSGGPGTGWASSGPSARHCQLPGQQGAPGDSTNPQCVGSRTDNGGRTLEAPMRRPATE